MLSNNFKCQVCDSIPEDRLIFQCDNNHVMCVPCGLKSQQRICTVDAKVMTVASNAVFEESPAPQPQPIETSSKMPEVADRTCPYKLKGCKWTFVSLTEVEMHTEECKYRSYTCIGTKFGIWNCDWNGTLHDIEEHLKTAHTNMTAPYSYWHNDSMPFIPNQTTKRINLIDAFNKKFIFYYTAEANSPNVSFLIFLLGRKVDAQKYLIDFELKQNLRKVKFVDNCPCDTDNLDQMIEENRCITISKNIVETFLNDGNINFRFIIKRRDLFEAEELKKERYVKQHPLPAATDAADKLKPQQPPQPLQRQQLQQRQPMQRPQQPMNMMFRSPLMMREKRSLPLQNTKWKQSHISNQSPVVNILRDARGSADVMTSGGSNGGGAAFQSDDGRYRRPFFQESQNRFLKKRYNNEEKLRSDE